MCLYLVNTRTTYHAVLSDNVCIPLFTSRGVVLGPNHLGTFRNQAVPHHKGFFPVVGSLKGGLGKWILNQQFDTCSKLYPFVFQSPRAHQPTKGSDKSCSIETCLFHSVFSDLTMEPFC